MAITGALAAAARVFDPYPEAILALDFAGVRTGGRQFYKHRGIIVPRFEMLSGALSTGQAGFGTAQINSAWRGFPANAPLIGDGGLGVWEARTNKCTNFNANPTDLTGMSKSGDAAATLTVVDDVAALEAAGLQGLCTSGKVYALNNSAGSANAFVDISGVTGNTNAHSLSIFMRALAGSPGIRYNGVTYGSPVAAYTRLLAENITATSGNRFAVIAPPGAVAHFILNQLEEGSFATAPIVVQGLPATRTAVAQSVSGLNLPPVGYIYAEWVQPIIQTTTRTYVWSVKESTNDRLRLAASDGFGSSVIAATLGDGTAISSLYFSAPAAGTLNRALMAYDTTSARMAFTRNGGDQTAARQLAAGTISNAQIGLGQRGEGVNTGQFNTTLRRLRIVPGWPSEAERIAITTGGL